MDISESTLTEDYYCKFPLVDKDGTLIVIVTLYDEDSVPSDLLNEIIELILEGDSNENKANTG